jgi:hypothetical protein
MLPTKGEVGVRHHFQVKQQLQSACFVAVLEAVPSITNNAM